MLSFTHKMLKKSFFVQQKLHPWTSSQPKQPAKRPSPWPSFSWILNSIHLFPYLHLTPGRQSYSRSRKQPELNIPNKHPSSQVSPPPHRCKRWMIPIRRFRAKQSMQQANQRGTKNVTNTIMLIHPQHRATLTGAMHVAWFALTNEFKQLGMDLRMQISAVYK